MDDLFEVPNRAIESFERLTGLAVAIHDPGGAFTPHLPAWRFLHQTPVCVAVKARVQDTCIAFDVDQTQAHLRDHPDGATKLCHAGIIEWIAPISRDGQLETVIFAGQRLPAPTLAAGLRDRQHPTPLPLGDDVPAPPTVDASEAETILEALCQLAARLDRWCDDVDAHFATGAAPSARDRDIRRSAIERFVDQRHRQPLRLADLATYLGLSPSRTAHAVSGACGRPFTQILAERRLLTATSLLRHSDLPITAVADSSGFGDVSNFHRAFRRHTGTTPLRFRHAERAAGRGGARV